MPATKIRRPTEKARPELARVRVGVPVLPARHVSRARLHAALDDRRQITVVSAPAGFGKTTLLASWLAATAAVDGSPGWRWRRTTTTRSRSSAT